MWIYYSIMSDLKCGTTLPHTYMHIPTFTSFKQHWVYNKNIQNQFKWCKALQF